jgi:hypothetical protein
MGLDMFLHAKLKGGYDENGDHISPPHQLGYWRKANAIHKWFVDNCQDGIDECQETEISLVSLLSLRNSCLSVKNDHDKASEILPTESGFFFGNTNYTDFYFEDIDETLNIIDRAVKYIEAHPDMKLFYMASW